MQLEKKVENSMQNREFSIEESYHIFVFFLMEFWWGFFKGVMIEKDLITDGMTRKQLEVSPPDKKNKHINYESYDFIFHTLPGLPCGCSKHFEKLVEKRLSVSNKEKSCIDNLIIKEKILFQLIIDFPSYIIKEFKGIPEEPLNFVIEWFEDMRKHPENHEKEWKIWNKEILNITKHGHRSNVAFGTHFEEEDLYLYYPGGPSRLYIQDFK